MKQYTDKLLDSGGELFGAVRLESQRQIRKWGIQTHTMFEWLNYATEELGELAKAISEHQYRNGTKDDIYKEAIQVATLSLKIAEMIKNVQTKKNM